MSAERNTECKSIHELAFDHYLRTGERLTSKEWLARHERKFNPYHDELGRFTSSPGVTVSYGNQTARMAEPPRLRERGTGAAPAKTIPPGGQILAEAGLRAARLANEAVARARNYAMPVSPPIKALLNQIVNGEGVGDEDARRHGFASSYDVPFNYGRCARQIKPLTQMTLKEIDELQTRMLMHPDNRLRASPVGRYQIVRSTLREMRQNLHLDDNMVFDEILQDTLGMSRLRRAGLQDYMDGKLSASGFQTRIAREWASVAEPKTDRPRLQGQHLGTTSAQISPLILALRRQ